MGKPADKKTGMNCFTQTKHGDDILWCVLGADAQIMAMEKYGRELTEKELGIVANSLGHGFEDWHVILREAIEIAVEKTKEAEDAKK